MHAFAWISMVWKDEFLQWDPSDYDNVTYIVVDANDIWFPDLDLRNSASSIYGDIFDSSKYKVPVYSDGTVYFYTAGKTTTFCQLNTLYFPFDKQACYVHIDSWTYPESQILLNNRNDSVVLDLYHENGAWDIIGTKSLYHSGSFNGDLYSELRFNVYFRRKPLYIVINLILPSASMAAIILFVFLLPAAADEKMTLSVTLLLSFSVFLLSVGDQMPHISDYVPIITMYITFVMCLAAASLLATIVVMMLHHADCQRPPPAWVVRAATFLAQTFYMSIVFKEPITLMNDVSAGDALMKIENSKVEINDTSRLTSKLENKQKSYKASDTCATINIETTSTVKSSSKQNEVASNMKLDVSDNISTISNSNKVNNTGGYNKQTENNVCVDFKTSNKINNTSEFNKETENKFCGDLNMSNKIENTNVYNKQTENEVGAKVKISNLPHLYDCDVHPADASEGTSNLLDGDANTLADLYEKLAWTQEQQWTERVKEENRKTWVQVATVVDRFFFFLFLPINIVASVVLLVVLPGLQQTDIEPTLIS